MLLSKVTMSTLGLGVFLKVLNQLKPDHSIHGQLPYLLSYR